jgi:glycosyltransferase involved in cell wall biosynthesis
MANAPLDSCGVCGGLRDIALSLVRLSLRFTDNTGGNRLSGPWKQVQSRPHEREHVVCEGMTPPLVSIVTVFRDGERFIRDAITSVLVQSYENWELLLVDDGSTDQSSTIAKQAAADRPQYVRYLEHPGHRNLGISASRNLGASKAKGEFIVYLDCDDILFEDNLELQVAALERNPSAVMSISPALFWSWDRSLYPEHEMLSYARFGDGAMNGHELFKAMLPRNGPCWCGTMFRRSTFLAVGGAEPQFPGVGEDTVVYTKLFSAGDVVVSDQCLSAYRLHGDSLSTKYTGWSHRRLCLSWVQSYLQGVGKLDFHSWLTVQWARLQTWPNLYCFCLALWGVRRGPAALLNELGRKVGRGRTELVPDAKLIAALEKTYASWNRIQAAARADPAYARLGLRAVGGANA